jgi:hypothetical protein
MFSLHSVTSTWACSPATMLRPCATPWTRRGRVRLDARHQHVRRHGEREASRVPRPWRQSVPRREAARARGATSKAVPLPERVLAIDPVREGSAPMAAECSPRDLHLHARRRAPCAALGRRGPRGHRYQSRLQSPQTWLPYSMCSAGRVAEKGWWSSSRANAPWPQLPPLALEGRCAPGRAAPVKRAEPKSPGMTCARRGPRGWPSVAMTRSRSCSAADTAISRRRSATCARPKP